MTSYYHTTADGDLPTKTELARYKSDSKHALASRSKFRRNRIKGHLSAILNRMTLINSSVSILALVALPLVASVHA